MKERKNIKKSWSFLKSLGIILLLAASCCALGFAIVFPLWKWASTSPSSYTWACLVLLLALFIFIITKICIKKGTAITLLKLAEILVLFAGIILSIYLVLWESRILSLITFIAAIVVFGVLRFVCSKVSSKNKY